jgi:hypothetical protein
MQQIHPSTAKRTLGVWLSPDGNGSTQMSVTITKAREFLGKLTISSLTKHAKWLAIEAMIELSLMYPLINTIFSDMDIKPVESILSNLRCSVLGLNRNFPRALLYGPALLGSLGLPSPKHKNTRHHINYFLFNCQHSSPISHKLDITILYSQLEVGIFHQFLSQPYHRYRHLATTSFICQIWKETEQHEITL